MASYKRIYFLLLFISFSLPFWVGFGAIPITNFVNESAAFAGFWMLIILCAPLMGRQLSRQAIYGSAVFLILILGALWHALAHPANEYSNEYLLIQFYLLSAVCCHVVAALMTEKFGAEDILRPVFFVIFIGALGAAAASFIQFLGLDGSDLMVSPVVDQGRTFGFVRQPNHQSTFLMMGVIATLYIFRSGLRSRVIGTGFLVFLISALASTGSRTAVLQIVFSSLFLLFFQLQDEGVRKLKKALFWLAPLLIFLAVWGVFFYLSHSQSVSFYGVNKVQQTASEGLGIRSEIWRSTLHLISQNPWLGYGPLSYQVIFFLSGSVLGSKVVMSNSHNILLQIAFDYGLLVLVLVLFFFFLSVKESILKMKDSGRFAILVLGVLLLHSFFEFPLWHGYFLLPFSFFWGVVAASGGVENKKYISLSSVFPKTLILASGVALGVVFWIGSDFYKITPVYSPGGGVDLRQKVITAKQAFWFKKYANFPDSQLKEAIDGDPKAYLAKVATLGCVMQEPWYQIGTMVSLARLGYVDDLKWIVYLYKSLVKDTSQLQKGLQPYQAEAGVAAVLEFMQTNDVPPKSTRFYEATCQAS